MGMQPPGFADQMRQQGQIGPPPGGPPMMGGGPPMAPPQMGEQQDQGDMEVKMMLAMILQILTGQHNGGPPEGAPGQPGMSPGMPM